MNIGTAGWAVPRDIADRFESDGSALSRYSGRLQAVEINTSFHRPHRRTTYARWAASVPDEFRFAVKLPKTISHALRLRNCSEPLERFLGEISGLGPKLGPVLVQLPPSLPFEASAADAFFNDLRSRHGGAVACEPRHPTWFEDTAERLLIAWKVARVAADPARYPQAADPGGWPGLVYFRLHGSPRTYYSSYEPTYLANLAEKLAAMPVETWCIFDNTASGAAGVNALDLASYRANPHP